MKEKKHGGDIYTYLDKYQKVPLDFSANVNPAGLPKKVKKALCKSVSKFAPYPDTECRELRKKIAEYEQVAEENLVFGCGAADLIFRIVRTLKPRTALLAAPCFSEYAEALKSEQCSIGYFYLQEQNNFILNKDFLSVIAQPLQIIFICSPNNPTGQVVEKSIVYEILEKANSIGCYVVLDECFMDCTHFKDDYKRMAMRIKMRISQELGFNCNIGISTNKLLAKMASDFKPKNTIHTLFKDEIPMKKPQ